MYVCTGVWTSEEINESADTMLSVESEKLLRKSSLDRVCLQISFRAEQLNEEKWLAIKKNIQTEHNVSHKFHHQQKKQ